MRLPATVSIVEVGPRDGLQHEPAFIPTEAKIALIEAIAAAGVRRIETTSFVSPRAVPQLADAAEVLRGVQRQPGVAYSALVPNLKGAERAIDAGTDALRVVISATDAGNRANLGRTVDESFADLEGIVARAHLGGCRVELVLGLAFGCPLTGAVDPDRVVQLAMRAEAVGVAEFFAADSYGFAGPAEVASLVGRLDERCPALPIGLHLHDTRGLGLANVLAALNQGVTSFDSSVGGLGSGGLAGQFALGNIASEDVVNLCEELGISTGIDIDALIGASRQASAIVGRDLPGRIQAAGTRSALFARIARQRAQAAADDGWGTRAGTQDRP